MVKTVAAQSHGIDDQQALARTAVVLPAVLAALLGLFILYGVGIAQPDLIHNAAHDTRHAIAFPCH
jgi:cobalt transporter subunit CbtB